MTPKFSNKESPMTPKSSRLAETLNCNLHVKYKNVLRSLSGFQFSGSDKMQVEPSVGRRR